jgi:hypothetical protein
MAEDSESRAYRIDNGLLPALFLTPEKRDEYMMNKRPWWCPVQLAI